MSLMEFMVGLVLCTVVAYPLLNGCSRIDESATLYTLCEPSQDEAFVSADRMAGLFCATGDKTNRFSTEFLGLDKCVKPDASTGWYVKFKVTCLGELP